MNRETGSRDVVANKFFRWASKTDGISGDPSDLSGFFSRGTSGIWGRMGWRIASGGAIEAKSAAWTLAGKYVDLFCQGLAVRILWQIRRENGRPCWVESGMVLENIQVPFEKYSGVIPEYPGAIREYPGVIPKYPGVIPEYSGVIHDYQSVIHEYPGVEENTQDYSQLSRCYSRLSRCYSRVPRCYLRISKCWSTVVEFNYRLSISPQ